ncbi:tyrosine-type recombinase/integrase [Salipaludibacillus sp. CF4.18]|uniref:site-specific integrase n=1 Tax=Salipaludibacillus sp. CF4.18 TaxID=3373081 RepID=UPI003EE69C95
MARIYKKDSNNGLTWGYVVYVGTDPGTGKERRVYKQGFRTKKDAKLAAAIIENQLDKGEYIQPTSTTFEALLQDWEQHYANLAKESSLRARRIALKHINFKFGKTPIQKIKKKSYQDCIDELATKFSTNYIASIHTSANMVFEYALENKLIKDVPTKGVKIPKKIETVEDLEKQGPIQEKFLEKEELEEFLSIAKEEGLEGDLLAFTMLAYTGLRIGEMIALRWSDIDYTELTLRVYKTYYNPTNNKLKYKLLTPKNTGSRRTITIDPILISLLQLNKVEQDKIKKENKQFYNDDNFIFAMNEGYPKTIKHISIRMSRLLKKSSITKKLTPHSFRHTHTSLLIEANVHIKEIQERLGHSDINTTMDIYAHMTKNIKKEASNKFGNLMENLSKNLID